MQSNGYHSDELKAFHRVLASAISEARVHSLNLPVTEMTQRLFSAADKGERDPQKLKEIVLAGATNALSGADPLPITISSGSPSKRPVARHAKGKSPPRTAGTL